MTTYVLVPGAGGEAWYWSRVVGELTRRGHEAITVDLPAADESAGLAEYVDVVVAAAEGQDDVVIVAQSMGALTAPLACKRLPVSLLVLVNAMVPAPGETGSDWWGATGQDGARRSNDEQEGRSPDGEFDPFTYFLHDVPPDVLAEAGDHDSDQSGRPFEDPWPLDGWPDVLTRVVSGRDDRFFPVEFQRRVSQERLGVTPDVLPGGHLVALSNPVGLVGLLESYQRR